MENGQVGVLGTKVNKCQRRSEAMTDFEEEVSYSLRLRPAPKRRRAF